jgi:hypothetical protein
MLPSLGAAEHLHVEVRVAKRLWGGTITSFLPRRVSGRMLVSSFVSLVHLLPHVINMRACRGKRSPRRIINIIIGQSSCQSPTMVVREENDHPREPEWDIYLTSITRAASYVVDGDKRAWAPLWNRHFLRNHHL